ncbi:hypothetical protein Q7P37_000347 [Cladosporium fusiforme]
MSSPINTVREVIGHIGFSSLDLLALMFGFSIVVDMFNILLTALSFLAGVLEEEKKKKRKNGLRAVLRGVLLMLGLHIIDIMNGCIWSANFLMGAYLLDRFYPGGLLAFAKWVATISVPFNTLAWEHDFLCMIFEIFAKVAFYQGIVTKLLRVDHMDPEVGNKVCAQIAVVMLLNVVILLHVSPWTSFIAHVAILLDRYYPEGLLELARWRGWVR